MKKKILIYGITISFFAAMVGLLAYVIWPVELITDSMTLELGENISTKPEDYFTGLKWSVGMAEIDVSDVEIEKPGTYQAICTHGWEEYQVQILVEDTTAPEIIQKEEQIYLKVQEEYEASNLINSASDLSGNVNLTIDGDTKIRFDECGTYDITIVASDESGNQTRVMESVIVDTPPQIEGTENFYLTAGDTWDYLAGVTAIDDVDGDLSEEISVDVEEVDINAEGTYEIIYTVSDAYGLETRTTAEVHVLAAEEISKLTASREINWRTAHISEVPGKYDAGAAAMESEEAQMEYMEPSIVHIYIDHPNERYKYVYGSGYIIDIRDGYVYICTNHHVINMTNKGEVYFFDGSSAEYEVVGSNKDRDVAVIRIQIDSIAPDTYGDLVTVHISETAWEKAKTSRTDAFVEIMNKEGLNYTRKGETVAYGEARLTGKGENYLQVSIKLVSGNSGSAILDSQGNLIGMATFLERVDGVYSYYGVGMDWVLETYESVTGNQLYTE